MMFLGAKLYLGNNCILSFFLPPPIPSPFSFPFSYIFPLIVNIIPFAERLLMRMI